MAATATAAAFVSLMIVVSHTIVLIDTASATHLNVRRSSSDGPDDLCDSEIYCEGPLLHTVQLAEIFNDSKTFVDLSQLHDPDITMKNFNELMRNTNNSPNSTEVEKFVEENFSMQDELYNSTLPDWRESPAILERIKDPQFRELAKELNKIWKKLARKMSNDIAANPQRHSLISVNNTFIIPGGRFREFYYWDSYWIIEGLLLCDMNNTAKGIIENFLSMVKRYNFIPNGGRVYYLSRSQPPMLIAMVAKYYKFTNDVDFLRNNIATLEAEFEYWQDEKTVNVTKNGKTYKLAHYVVNSNGPRPESYKEDYKLAQQLSENEREPLYNNLKAAAESGWDFSYRWCIKTNEQSNVSLLNVSTIDIIPVDLNAILERNARHLATFHFRLGNIWRGQRYLRIAQNYRTAIHSVLWNDNAGIWLDYDVRNQRSRNTFYPSNLSPLYTMSYSQTARKKTYYARKAIDYLRKNNVDEYVGGTPTSLNQTGEQWDFPNAWPPLQSFLVLGLYRTGTKEAVEYAETLARRWLMANYMGYEETGKMFEKYDATDPGKSGGGGEYHVQEGFGWTNGIVFEFLNTFPNIRSKMPSAA